MGGNFPAGKRERRNRRERFLIFGTRGRPGGGTKVSREPAGTLRYPFVTKNRNLLKIETFISSSILARFRQF